MRDTTLVAQGFDVSSGKLAGGPSGGEDLGTDAVGLADFSASRNGVLEYPRGTAPGADEYVWFDRKGVRAAAATDPGNLGLFDLSADGRCLAFRVGGLGESDLWTRDLKRGVSSRFTFEKGARGHAPVLARQPPWSTCSAPRPEADPTLESLLDRTGRSGTLSSERGAPCLGAEPGRRDVDRPVRAPTSPADLAAPARAPGTGKHLVATEFQSTRPALSPDGRWLAFESNESGDSEVYVSDRGRAGRWQTSRRGRRGGRPGTGRPGLFYLSPEQRLIG